MHSSNESEFEQKLQEILTPAAPGTDDQPIHKRPPSRSDPDAAPGASCKTRMPKFVEILIRFAAAALAVGLLLLFATQMAHR